MSSIAHKSKSVLDSLAKVLAQLSNDEYCYKVNHLNYSCIGEHTRHILEMFEELLNGYETSVVNYDKRNRNHQLETDVEFALEKIQIIMSRLDKPNKDLQIDQQLLIDTTEIVCIPTNYFRELVYNIEHTAHHKALIRVALSAMNISERIDSNFGYADSTLIYKAGLSSNS